MQQASAGTTAEEYPMAARQCSIVLTVGDEDDHSPGVLHGRRWLGLASVLMCRWRATRERPTCWHTTVMVVVHGSDVSLTARIRDDDVDRQRSFS